MPTKEDLKYFQSMPLDIKVAMTRTRIREWVNYYGESGTYISFSGGKDSTVLLHLVRELYPDTPAVFVNTGLEYPEIQSFVKSFDNVVIIKPEIPFNEVIKKHGYPIIGKDIAHKIDDARKKRPWAIKFFDGTVKIENESTRYDLSRYKELLTVDFNISSLCCNVMKKKPLHKYERAEDRKAFIGTLAEESAMRQQTWLKYSCNSFETKPPKSQPMSFWTENDILQYIVENNLKIASVYGEIIKANKDNQLCMIEDQCGYKCSNMNRTGCIFCGFGAQFDEYSRFILLKQTHPKQYNYCIQGGEYDIEGTWKPNKKGLGMGHVFDVLNKLYSKNGKPFIEY